nr:hypothetical protein Itr_chr07CG19060 [Ipomoea trifida]
MGLKVEGSVCPPPSVQSTRFLGQCEDEAKCGEACKKQGKTTGLCSKHVCCCK